MLKYQRKKFKSLFHLDSIDRVKHLVVEEGLPIQIEVTIKNKEIGLPATITLDYMSQPVFSIEIDPVITDFELLYVATDCLQKISKDNKVINLMNTEPVRMQIFKLDPKLKNKLKGRNENKCNMEVFCSNVKYKINGDFYDSKEKIEIIKNNVDLLLTKMDDVKSLLKQIKSYISDLKVQEETKSLYFYCIQSFYEWMFYIKREKFPIVTVAELNEYLEVYKASNYYKNLAIKQVLIIQEIRKSNIDFTDVKWKEISPKEQTLYDDDILIEVEIRLLENLATHKRQIEDYNNYLRSIGMESHSYSRLRDLMRNWIYFRLAAETMLKSSELIALDFKDIDLDNLRIIAKKLLGKQVVAITQETATYVAKYRAFRKGYDDKIEEEKHYYRWVYGSVLKEKSKREEELSLIKPFFNDYERREFNQIAHDLAEINGQIDTIKKLSRHQQTKEPQSLGDLRKDRKALNNKFAKKYAEVKRKYDNKIDENIKDAVFVSSHSKRVNSNTMEKILSSLGLTTEALRFTRYKKLNHLRVYDPALRKIMGYENRQNLAQYEYERTLKNIEKSRINFLEEKKIDEILTSTIVDEVFKLQINKYPTFDKIRLKQEVEERYEDYNFTRLSLLEGVFERHYAPLPIELEMQEKEKKRTKTN